MSATALQGNKRNTSEKNSAKLCPNAISIAHESLYATVIGMVGTFSGGVSKLYLTPMIYTLFV